MDDYSTLEDVRKALEEYSEIEETYYKKKKKRYVRKYMFVAYKLLCTNVVDALNKHYKLTKDASSLQMAIGYGECAIKMAQSSNDTRLLAFSQLLTATAYRFLAENEDDAKKLEKSIEYGERALTFYEGSGDRFLIIQLHNNLGNVYSSLCINKAGTDSEKRTQNFIMAHSHFLEAINACSYLIYPEQYAMNYMNLGVLICKYAYCSETCDPDYLYEAKDAFEKSLSIYTLDTHPFEYACCQKNYMLVVKYQGMASHNEALLKEAIEHGNAALTVFTAADYPAYNIDTHEIMGFIFDTLATLTLAKESEEDALLFQGYCMKAIEHLELVALEQLESLDSMRIIAALIRMSLDILNQPNLPSETRLKFSISFEKYRAKLHEIKEQYPDVYKQFIDELPTIQDGVVSTPLF